MKIQPRLFLTSFCALLASAAIVEAQSPRPRFGYGSAPAGASVSPAPNSAPKAKPESKPKSAVAAATKAKPKPAAPKPKVVATAKTPTSKPSASKSTEDKNTTKQIADSKSRKSPSQTTKPVIAKAAPPPRSGKSSSAPNKSAQVAESGASRAKPAPTTGKAMSSNITKPSPRVTARDDIAQASPSRGFTFFGAPIVLPAFPEAAPLSRAAEGKGFVDLMAARHSLRSPVATFKPRLPEPKTLPKETLPVAVVHHPKPALEAFVERAPEHAAGAAPEISPPALAARDFQPSPGEAQPLTASSTLLDEPTLARTAPASLILTTTTASSGVIPETTLLDEPALPSPVISTVEKPTISPVKARISDSNAEPPLPTATPANEGPEALAEAPGEHDLSERERAFVRSLAEAAGSVTTASGKMNRDLPVSITTAATTLINQIPAETVSSFRSVAKTARASVQDVVPDLPIDMGTDLLPERPDKMPDKLPNFDSASSGKIDVQSDRQADYDQANNKVIFTGKVELNSAAIRLRAERVEVFMKKGGGGMERVEARGNVLMRTQDTANGPGQMASAGRASYNLKTGEITLSDWPKIQETGKSHISTDPSTRMYMFTDGRLRTDGPNRTLIGGG